MKPIKLTFLEFVHFLYADSTPENGFIEVRYLPAPGGKVIKQNQVFMPYPTFAQHPDVWTHDKTPKGQQAYWGISLRLAAGKGTAAGCASTHLVWLDLDLKGTRFVGGQTDVQNMTAEELRAAAEELFAELMARCAELDLPPSLVVYTGHGLQVYWQRALRSLDKFETETYNKALQAAFEDLGADSKTTDIARVFRIPGAFNLKNPARPIEVEIWFQDESKPKIEAEQFAALIDDFAEASKPTPVVDPRPAKAAPQDRARVFLPGVDSDSVIAAYNAKWPIRAWLESRGYTPSGEDRYNRPGKDASGRDTKLMRRPDGTEGAYHHSSNDPVTGNYTEDARHILDAFDHFRLDEHGGDFTRAIRAAALETGLVRRWEVKERQFETPGVSINTTEAQDRQKAVLKRIADKLAAEPKPEKLTLTDYRDLFLAWCAVEGFVFKFHQVWRGWFRYENGVYNEVPDTVMLQTVDKVLQGYGFNDMKAGQLAEILLKVSHEEHVAAREVDQNPFELNVSNGILDLQTNDLTPHTPEYFSIIQSAAEYLPGAFSYEWDKFMRAAVPDEVARRTLQEFAGYCLTGHTGAQKALLLIGEGGTGKGTFIRVIARVLGNLATSSSLEAIKDGSFLVGMLVGKRMCIISELANRNVQDWSTFKRITGEDTIQVDVKNKTPYAVKLDIKLVILSNVLPHMGDDTANDSLMRRFLPVEFKIKPELEDIGLEARLTAPAELPGILNWCLEGLARVERNGYRFPRAINTDIGKEIIEESNKVITFLRDMCAPDDAAETPFSDIYNGYALWCEANGHYPLNSMKFQGQLTAAAAYFKKPLHKRRTTRGMMYTGLRISSFAGGWE